MGFMIVGMIVGLSIYVGINYYTARRLYQWLSLIFPHFHGKVYGRIYGLLALSLVLKMLLGMVTAPGWLKHGVNWISSYWMGIFVYLFLFFVVADLGLLLGRLAGLVPAPLPGVVRFYTGLAVAVLTAGMSGYGFYHARQISQTSYEVKIQNKPMTEGVQIVLVSDLHLGAAGSEKMLKDTVKKINSLDPDLVCIAGDLFDNDYSAIQRPAQAARLMKSIRSSMGVYACLGNHDGGEAFGEMMRFMEESGITVLKEEAVVLDDRLVLAGRLDGTPIGGFGGMERKRLSDITSVFEKELPVVVMDHNPANAGEYGPKVDLVLCGHTHHGQIWPGNLITDVMFENAYGSRSKGAGHPQVIVTSGAGTWGPPMRSGSDSEVVSIRMD